MSFQTLNALTLGLSAYKKEDRSGAELRSGSKTGLYGDGVAGSAYHLRPQQSMASCNHGVTGRASTHPQFH